MRVALLLPLLSVACLAPYEDVPVNVVSHQPSIVQVQSREPDYASLFRDAGPVADPTPTADEPPRVFVGGGGGSVTMNNVTINGDVYIGSSPSPVTVVPQPAPTGATIRACEQYVDRVETCSVRMIGSGEAAQRIVDSMEAARRTWRRFASDARVRDALADSCTVARRQYEASVASYCPE